MRPSPKFFRENRCDERAVGLVAGHAATGRRSQIVQMLAQRGGRDRLHGGLDQREGMGDVPGWRFAGEDIPVEIGLIAVVVEPSAPLFKQAPLERWRQPSLYGPVDFLGAVPSDARRQRRRCA